MKKKIYNSQVTGDPRTRFVNSSTFETACQDASQRQAMGWIESGEPDHYWKPNIEVVLDEERKEFSYED